MAPSLALRRNWRQLGSSSLCPLFLSGHPGTTAPMACSGLRVPAALAFLSYSFSFFLTPTCRPNVEGQCTKHGPFWTERKGRENLQSPLDVFLGPKKVALRRPHSWTLNGIPAQQRDSDQPPPRFCDFSRVLSVSVKTEAL